MVLLIMRRLDRVQILIKPGLVLRGLSGKEAVEVVKANPFSGRPEIEGTHGRGLSRWRVVPLSEGGGLIAVVTQDLREGRRRPRNDARIAIPVHRALGDGSGSDTLVVASGE